MIDEQDLLFEQDKIKRTIDKINVKKSDQSYYLKFSDNDFECNINKYDDLRNKT